MRKEPLIGLQYIVQLYPEVNCEDAFKCSLCRVIGPLYFIIKHIESFKHRRNYLSIAYKHLFPLYTKRQSYYERNWAVKQHAVKVEQQERTLTVNDFKSCNSRIGVKSDFWKYNMRRHEKLDEYREKLSAYETQKNNILQYMETLVITSLEEAEVVQKLTEELEAAVNVFHLNAMPIQESYCKRKREQSTEDTERRYSRQSDFHHDKRRSIWYEEDHKPSTSIYKDDVQSISDKHSPTEEDSTGKRSRSSSKDMLLRVTFSTGSEGETKNAVPQEEQESPTTFPDKKKFVVPSDNLWENTAVPWHNPCVDNIFQEIRAKRVRKYSTDVEKWESLFASHRPEKSNSVFWNPKSPSLNNTEVSSSEEKKENPRRASLDALSSFTLFSQEEHEHGPASCQSSSSFQGQAFKFSKGNVFKGEPKIERDKNEELPCSSNTVCNEAGTADDVDMPNKAEPCDDECILKAETGCDQLTDVNANATQQPKSSRALDVSSVCSNVKACGSRHVDAKTDSQDSKSSVVGNTLTSSKLHASRRQLSPEVLQLFKGKDTNSIIHILKTLSPFYPALQEVDLETFAEVLSKTGTISE
ncbi:uncharacterized protein [Dendropsophus ebraccatus]